MAINNFFGAGDLLIALSFLAVAASVTPIDSSVTYGSITLSTSIAIKVLAFLNIFPTRFWYFWGGSNGYPTFMHYLTSKIANLANAWYDKIAVQQKNFQFNYEK